MHLYVRVHACRTPHCIVVVVLIAAIVLGPSGYTKKELPNTGPNGKVRDTCNAVMVRAVIPH